MSGTTNFIQINPTAANQENDSTYQTDPITTGGIAANSIMPSPWMNKAWFQSSTFVAAMCQMLANKNFSTSDVNVVTLSATLANILTTFDINSLILVSAGQPGSVKLLNGQLLINCGITVPIAPGGGETVGFATAFTNTIVAVLCAPIVGGPTTNTKTAYVRTSH